MTMSLDTLAEEAPTSDVPQSPEALPAMFNAFLENPDPLVLDPSTIGLPDRVKESILNDKRADLVWRAIRAVVGVDKYQKYMEDNNPLDKNGWYTLDDKAMAAKLLFKEGFDPTMPQKWIDQIRRSLLKQLPLPTQEIENGMIYIPEPVTADVTKLDALANQLGRTSFFAPIFLDPGVSRPMLQGGRDRKWNMRLLPKSAVTQRVNPLFDCPALFEFACVERNSFLGSTLIRQRKMDLNAKGIDAKDEDIPTTASPFATAELWALRNAGTYTMVMASFWKRS